MFVLAGKFVLSNLIDGSFFVPYFTLILYSISRTKTVVLLVCMEWFQGSSCSHKTALPRCFPKASAKVVQLFLTANYFDKKITKKQHFFKNRQKDHERSTLLNKKRDCDHIFVVLQHITKKKTDSLCTVVALPYLYHIIILIR